MPMSLSRVRRTPICLFLPYLPASAHILDLGCGSGRDSAYFSSLGYEVTAVDGSAELCKRVTEKYGIDAYCLRFEEIEFTSRFDAIWASASLLHIPKADTSVLS